MVCLRERFRGCEIPSCGKNKAWNPHLQEDIDKIERVKRWVTRVPTGFEKLEYEERLKMLSLNNRRLRGDLIETVNVIEMYNVICNRENINWFKPLNLRKNKDISGQAESVRGSS